MAWYDAKKSSTLVNPDGRTDGWTTVSTGNLTSLPAVTLNPSLVAASRYLDIELDFNLAGFAEVDYVLALNGSTASIGSCIVNSWIVATEQTPRRPATINLGGCQTGDPVYKCTATLELTPGRFRMFTANAITHGGSFANERSQTTGYVSNTSLVISTVQIVGTVSNNITAGSRQRFTLR